VFTKKNAQMFEKIRSELIYVSISWLNVEQHKQFSEEWINHK